jgi:hypothetical protein
MPSSHKDSEQVLRTAFLLFSVILIIPLYYPFSLENLLLPLLPAAKTTPPSSFVLAGTDVAGPRHAAEREAATVLFCSASI